MIKVNENYCFCCDECPICEELEHRIKIAKELNDEPQLEYCSCEKIGTPFYSGGYCEDAQQEEKTKKDNPRKTGRANRRHFKETKFKKRKKMCKEQYPNFWLGKEEKYIMKPKNSKAKKLFKKKSNKTIRKNNIYVLTKNKNYYKKMCDKWIID